MAGKREAGENRLASTRQLWVLNRAGRLRLIDDEDDLEPISSAQADAGIKYSMAKRKDAGEPPA